MEKQRKTVAYFKQTKQQQQQQQKKKSDMASSLVSLAHIFSLASSARVPIIDIAKELAVYAAKNVKDPQCLTLSFSAVEACSHVDDPQKEAIIARVSISFLSTKKKKKKKMFAKKIFFFP